MTVATSSAVQSAVIAAKQVASGGEIVPPDIITYGGVLAVITTVGAILAVIVSFTALWRAKKRAIEDETEFRVTMKHLNEQVLELTRENQKVAAMVHNLDLQGAGTKVLLEHIITDLGGIKKVQSEYAKSMTKLFELINTK